MADSEKVLNKILGVASYFYKKQTTPISKEISALNNLSSFVKAKADAFGIEKLVLSFVNYDNKTKKLKDSIDCYLSFGDALYLFELVTSSQLAKLCQKEKTRVASSGEKYCKDIYSSPLGGIHEDTAKKRGLRTDGLAISRCFSIAPGLKQDYVITCKQSAGKTNEKGLIVPTGKPEVLVRVACSSMELRKFATLITKHIEGYICSQYVVGGYAKESKEEK